MCLSVIFRNKQKKEYLAKMPDEVIVWKVVHKRVDGSYITDCKHFPLHAGEVRFTQNIIHRVRSSNYRGGGHFFKTRKAAKVWGQFAADRVIRCTTKKVWINTVGTQRGATVLVVKRAIFPDYISKGKGTGL